MATTLLIELPQSSKEWSFPVLHAPSRKNPGGRALRRLNQQYLCTGLVKYHARGTLAEVVRHRIMSKDGAVELSEGASSTRVASKKVCCLDRLVQRPGYSVSRSSSETVGSKGDCEQ